MDWPSVPVVRTVTSGLVLVLVGALAGCGDDDRLYEEAATAAEAGVATSLEITANQTTSLLTERAAVSEISAEDIVAIFLNDARNYEAGPLNVVGTRALFDMVENADGSVTFSVFFRANSYRAGGLSSTSQSRHSCGSITGRFTEDALSVNDLECPPELAAITGESSILLSMTENAAKHGLKVGTSP